MKTDEDDKRKNEKGIKAKGRKKVREKWNDNVKRHVS